MWCPLPVERLRRGASHRQQPLICGCPGPFGAVMSRSRTKMLVVTRSLLRDRCEQRRFPEQTRASPTLQPVRMLRGGGQGRQGDGHTCRSDGRREGEDEGDATRARERAGAQAGEWSASVVEIATPAPDPLWDLISARSPSDGPGINCNSLNCNSTREEASCCHPNLWAPGS